MFLAASFVIGTALLCVALPLLVYGTTLAAFGLPHVIAEMRYVHGRFSGRWSRGMLLCIASILAGIVLIRILLWVELLGKGVAKPLELGFVGLLIAITLPTLWRHSRRAAAFGFCLLVGVAWGTSTAPVLTALSLAVLHNFTPIGFFFEAIPKPKQRRAMLLCLFVFIGGPLLIASGMPYLLLQSLGLTAPESTLIDLGSLSRHIGVYVPKQWHMEHFALPLFSALVFAQCMHYGAVIHLLPRLQPTDRHTHRKWGILLLVIGGATLAAFSHDFFLSRRAYGLFAAVHAWIEVPILLAALLGPAHCDSSLTPAAT
jgi:hypothetical protein